MIAAYPIYLPWLALVALLFWLKWSFWPNKPVNLPIAGQQEIMSSNDIGAPLQSVERSDICGKSPDALDAIRQIMPTVGDRPGPFESAPQLPPQLPMWKAAKRIAKALGDADKKGGYPDTLEAIRQAALDGHIEIWGKRELPPPMEPGLSSDEWTPINPLFWRTHQINSLATDKMSEGSIHSCSNPIIYGEQNSCWSLRVRLSDIEQIWPDA